MSPYSYYLEWKRESNPWNEAYRAEISSESGGTFLSFFLFLLIFAALNVSGQRIGRQHGPASLLSSRPTVLAGTFHALATSAISIYLLAVAPLLSSKERSIHDGSSSSGSNENPGLHMLWQKVAIPLSIAYFASDSIWYCLPRSDGLIFFHHVIMCFCHYPVINDAGAALAGAGDGKFAIWLSIVGYTSEVSTCLMNYRWYLIQTLEENFFGFALVNILVVVSWAYRIILFAYLLAWEIIPRTSLYVKKKQILTYIIMFMGHTIIGLLSLYWLSMMCRGGLKSLLKFKKKEKNKWADNGSAVSFSFGDDIGRDDCCGTSRSSERKEDKSTYSPSRIVQAGIDEAKEWVDGTLFLNKEKAA